MVPNNSRKPLPNVPRDPPDGLAAVRIAAWGGAGLASLILAGVALVAPSMQQADVAVTGSTQAVPENHGKEAGSGYALAFGESRTLEGLRSRWADLSGRHTQLGSLTPLVLTRMAANGPAYMLLAGPLPNAVAAAQACRNLRASGVACEATLFAGETLPSN
jgi:hypothetical protein